MRRLVTKKSLNSDLLPVCKKWMPVKFEIGNIKTEILQLCGN